MYIDYIGQIPQTFFPKKANIRSYKNFNYTLLFILDTLDEKSLKTK